MNLSSVNPKRKYVAVDKSMFYHGWHKFTWQNQGHQQKIDVLVFIIQCINKAYHQPKPIIAYPSFIRLKMPRCIAKKDNGTQCKCNAVIGSSFCGTHQTWTNVMSFETSNYMEAEWTSTYQPKYVASSHVGQVYVDDLYDILGR